MADAQIAVLDLMLFDNFPGAIDERCQPQDLATLGTASGHNVSTPLYPVGTKIRVKQAGTTTSSRAGDATLIYLQLSSQDATRACAAGFIAVPKASEEWWQMTTDKDAELSHDLGLSAVALSAMTTDYYGWFWCGGAAPVDLITGFASTTKCKTYNDGVTANCLLITMDGTEDAEGCIAYTPMADVISGDGGTVTARRPVGIALAADA